MQRKSGAAEVQVRGGNVDVQNDRVDAQDEHDAQNEHNAQDEHDGQDRHDGHDGKLAGTLADTGLESRFFNSHSLTPVELGPVDLPAEGMSPGSQRAMRVTVGLLVVSAIVFPAAYLYTHVIMPVPVEVGVSSPHMPSAGAFYAAPAPHRPAPPAAVPTAGASPRTMAATAASSDRGATAATTDRLAAADVQSNPAPPAAPPSEPAALDAPLPAPALVNAPASPSAADSPVTANSPVTTPPHALGSQSDSVTPSQVHVEGRSPATKRPRRTPRPGRRGRTDRVKRAMALLNAGKFAAAERVALRATRAQPRRAEGWLVLGAVRDALGKTQAATKAYRTCSVRASGKAAMACHQLASGR